jgi:hypothetical protein
MRRIRLENLFHNCGYVQITTIPSVNSEYIIELNPVDYCIDSFCARSIFGASAHFQVSTGGLPCGNYKSKVRIYVYQNYEDDHPTNKGQLWAKRRELIEKWMA